MIRDDDFSLRLAEWLEEGPFTAPDRGVDEAVAHAWAHPRGRVRWRSSRLRHRVSLPVPASRLVWLAAALVGLLLLGAAFAAGSRFLAVATLVCPTGSTPDQPGDPGLARPPVAQNIGGSLAWDRRAERVVFLARTATGGVPTRGSIWTFDVCANAWHEELATTSMPDRGPVVYDEDSDLTIAIGDVGVWVYDLKRGAWDRQAGAVPGWVDQAAYDPGSGLVIGRSTSTGTLSTYDVESDTWTEIDQAGSVPPAGGPSGFQLLGFDRSVGRVILTTESGTWQFDPRTGVWERAGLAGPIQFFIGGRQIAFDERRERTLVFGQGTVAAYDARTGDWQLLAGDPSEGWGGDRLPGLGAGYAMVCDPLNDRLLVIGGTHADEAQGWVGTDGVLAFDLVTDEWRELLAPSTSSTPSPRPSATP